MQTLVGVKKQRDSNMELLRIIAMLLVMIVHADFRALSCPSTLDTNLYPDSSFLRFFVESVSIICVNVFVLLSGWFGIRLKKERLLELGFQVLFFGALCLFISDFFFNANVPLMQSFKTIFLLHTWDYWFVKSYVGLCVFSPLLNAFVEKVDRKYFLRLLLLFFGGQTVYAWVEPSAAAFFENGYSTISFCGLYLLARYVHLYSPDFSQKRKCYDFLVYCSFVVVNTLLAFSFSLEGFDVGRFYLYTSPFVIMAACYFVLFFSKIKIQCSFVISK